MDVLPSEAQVPPLLSDATRSGKKQTCRPWPAYNLLAGTAIWSKSLKSLAQAELMRSTQQGERCGGLCFSVGGADGQQ